MPPILALPGPGMACLLILDARRQSDSVGREVNWKYTCQFLPCNLAIHCIWLLPADVRQCPLTEKWFESERVKSQDSTWLQLLNSPPIGETVRARTIVNAPTVTTIRITNSMPWTLRRP